MIYRIHPDVYQYQIFNIDADIVEDAMGEECLIYMDSTPTSYATSWKEIEIEFYDAITEAPDTNKKIPDIISDDGFLFLNEKAYRLLAPTLSADGEWLGVKYAGQQAYLLNVLSLAEQHEGIDEENTQPDNDGIVHLAFKESTLAGVSIFRTEEDSYLGIYCSEAIKELIEHHELKGCVLTSDLSDKPL